MIPYLFISLLFQLLLTPTEVEKTHLPEGFVYLSEAVPSILTEPRYYGSENFIGRPVDAYEAPRLITTKEAAEALKNIQADLKKRSLGLKVFDAYRPQQAVDHFMRWARDLSDTAKKSEYYPDVPKSQLFKKGYIAENSSHSRGSTVDVTLVDLSTGRELDMGTPYDFFSPKSWPSSEAVSQLAQDNRKLLQKTMERHGFKHLNTEWWHFTLKNEPYPETYFDFVVR